MLKKLLLSILCLSTLSSQAAPWIKFKALYPFIVAQTAAASGYFFNDAYKNHKAYKFCKREDEISKWTSYAESSSFALANDFYKIPAQESTDQNGDYQLKCEALQNIRDRLESKVHEVQKNIKNKQIKLVIIPTLSNKHFTKLLKKFEQPPEDIYTLIHQGFASSHGCIIRLPLKEIAKLYKLSNDKNKNQAQKTTSEDEKTNRAYEHHLQKIYASLGHELSHLENNDTENTIMATATIPFATEGIWQIGAKLFKRKPSPTHLSSFQFLYRTATQLPIGAAKFCLTGILLSYYAASQEYRCDKQSMEYMGKKATQADIKFFKSKAKKQELAINLTYDNIFSNFYLTITRHQKLLDDTKQASNDFEQAINNNNNKQEIIEKEEALLKLTNKLQSNVDRLNSFANKIFPLNDSTINFLSIMESGHPSNTYRAERLKKLLEQEEKKQK